jgi:hypothetical protein
MRSTKRGALRSRQRYVALLATCGYSLEDISERVELSEERIVKILRGIGYDERRMEHGYAESSTTTNQEVLHDRAGR